jgi:non-ribosomal peptide synthetase component F
VAALEALGRCEAATLYMVLLGAFATLLLRYTGQRDLIVGTPTANRGRVEVEELIGFFVNLLPLRVELAGNPTFRGLLAQVRETALVAFEHEEIPFDLLVQELQVEREPGRPPLVQVAFALQNAARAEVAFPGVRAASFGFEAHTVKFDLELTVGQDGPAAGVGMAYNTALFEPHTVDAMLADFVALLEEIVRDPDARVLDLALGTGGGTAWKAAPTAADEAEEFDFAF